MTDNLLEIVMIRDLPQGQTQSEPVNDAQVLTIGQARSLARQCLDAILLGKEPHPVEIERLCCFIIAVTRPLKYKAPGTK